MIDLFSLQAKIIQYFDKKGFDLLLYDYEEYLEQTYDYKRGNMNFIDMFLDYTKDGESPTSFWRWSAITAIAATMRDNYYLDKGLTKVYPNIYTILVARSGACRKGLPLKVTQSLLNKVKNTKIIAGRTSIQAVIKTLAEAHTALAPTPTGSFMTKGASGILYSEELAAFLVDDKATIKLLTDLYDNHEEWTSNLKATDTEKLHNTCLSMLAASNETFLKEVYTNEAIYGGLLARTVVVLENKRRQKNARVRVTEALDPTPLIQHLRKIAAGKGRMVYDDEAATYFEQWYNSVDDDSFESRSGVEARIHTTIEKVAMCLSMADENFDCIVKFKHIKEAKDLCLGLLKNYEFLTMSSAGAMSKSSAVAPKILAEIYKATDNQSTKSHLLRKFLGEYDVRLLDDVLNTLEQSKLVVRVVGGKEDIYRVTEKYIKMREEAIMKTREEKG